MVKNSLNKKSNFFPCEPLTNPVVLNKLSIGSKRSSGTHNANNGADVAGGGAPAPSYTAVGVAADEPEAPKLESKDFSRQLCEEINKLRATHGSPPLVYDADLSEGANV